MMISFMQGFVRGATARHRSSNDIASSFAGSGGGNVCGGEGSPQAASARASAQRTYSTFTRTERRVSFTTTSHLRRVSVTAS